MQISLSVPYDEKRLRRTYRFVLRPQLRRARILGWLIIVLGLAIVPLEPSNPLPYVFVVLGLFYVFALAPLSVRRCMRLQSMAIMDWSRLTLDDHSVTVTFPLVESRFKWTGLDRVVETRADWYAMVGKVQAVAIPKDLMTEEQRAEFGAFVQRLLPVWK
jgi:YcxB-like protein